MTLCKHGNLVLLPEKQKRLRCRHCHLTIKTDELGDEFCPECFERDRRRRYDFEEVESAETGKIRYRCEGCGAVIES